MATKAALATGWVTYDPPVSPVVVKPPPRARYGVPARTLDRVTYRNEGTIALPMLASNSAPSPPPNAASRSLESRRRYRAWDGQPSPLRGRRLGGGAWGVKLGPRSTSGPSYRSATISPSYLLDESAESYLNPRAPPPPAPATDALSAAAPSATTRRTRAVAASPRPPRTLDLHVGPRRRDAQDQRQRRRRRPRGSEGTEEEERNDPDWEPFPEAQAPRVVLGVVVKTRYVPWQLGELGEMGEVMATIERDRDRRLSATRREEELGGSGLGAGASSPVPEPSEREVAQHRYY